MDHAEERAIDQSELHHRTGCLYLHVELGRLQRRPHSKVKDPTDSIGNWPDPHVIRARPRTDLDMETTVAHSWLRHDSVFV